MRFYSTRVKKKYFNNAFQKSTDFPALTFAMLNILAQQRYVRNTQQRYVQISYTEIHNLQIKINLSFVFQ